MTPELTYLTWTALFTALLWLPYIANLILVRGITDAVGYPDDAKPIAAWAERMKAAHYNAVENLVVFGVLVLVANAIDLSNDVTTTAAAVFFWARVVHYFSYGFAVPWARTLSFAVAWAAMITIGAQILRS